MVTTKYNIGIDASRNRSGGARAHIIGIINEIVKDIPKEIYKIHIWSYPELLDKLSDDISIVKHSPTALKRSILHQLKWQYFDLKKEAKKLNVDILLNTDAGSICRFKPSITMSRDMLSYEKGEMKRFGFSMQRLRLFALRYVQNYSLNKSTAAVFLTQYAANVIKESAGGVQQFKIIPHGVSDNFRISSNNGIWREKSNKTIKCVYVSNVDLYKHQWNVALAFEHLRNEGYNVTIDFIGGGNGRAQKKFEEILLGIKNNDFVSQYDFIAHDQLPTYLKDKDIFIFASSCENMPNTLVEGMCTGLPIACSNRGPMPEVLKDAGVYFDPEDPESIKIAIKTIIEDDKQRMRIAERSKNLSFQYSWKRCAKETFDYLIEISNKIRYENKEK